MIGSLAEPIEKDERCNASCISPWSQLRIISRIASVERILEKLLLEAILSAAVDLPVPVAPEIMSNLGARSAKVLAVVSAKPTVRAMNHFEWSSLMSLASLSNQILLISIIHWKRIPLNGHFMDGL
jgi:hypothetical protein